MAKKLIASAVVAVALAALARFAFPDAILPDIFRSLGGGFPALQRVGPFPADRQAIDLLFRSRAPVNFSSSPATQWEIMKEWSSLQGFADSVCPRIPTLTNVCACNRTTAGRCDMFYYDIGAKFLSIPGIGFTAPYDTVDIPCEEAIASIANSSASRLMYYSRPVKKMNDTLLDLMQPLEPFSDRTRRVNVWVGSKGTVARMHYDSSPNWFLQVSGRKRFLLASPVHHWELSQFSFLHPGHRQTQLDPANASAETFPNFTKSMVEEVILSPGESLYIPAFYFHNVEALEPSISVNVYHEYSAKYNLQSLLSHRPEMPQNIPGVSQEGMVRMRAGLTRDYISALVNQVFASRAEQLSLPQPAPNASEFIRSVLSSRHAHTATDPLLQWGSVRPPALVEGPLCEPQESSSKTGKSSASAPGIASLGRSARDEASKALGQLLSFPAYDALSTVMADYVEIVAAHGVGVALVPTFFQQCFN